MRNDAEMRYIYMEMCMVLMEKERYERKRYKVKRSNDAENGTFSTDQLIQLLQYNIERGSERGSKEGVEYVILYAKSEMGRMEDMMNMTDPEKMIQRLGKEYYIYYEMIERRIRTSLPTEEGLLIHKDKLRDMDERIQQLYRDKKRKEVLRRTVL